MMDRNETSRAHSAAFVLKKALPGAVSQLLTLGVIAVIGLSAWGIWYRTGSLPVLAPACEGPIRDVA